MSRRPERWWAWPATAGAILAASMVFVRCFFADTDFAFQLNAFLTLSVPLALLAGSFASLFWAGKTLARSAGRGVSVRGVMLAVAVVALGFGTVRWWLRYNFATVYAPGYTEDAFHRVRLGMTPAEVEATLGRPLRRIELDGRPAPEEYWIYSDPPPPGTIGEDYWRRQVIFRKGKVDFIVDDYYVD